MREIKPYKTLPGAKAALDNGGRFFNLWARAGDDRITKDELTKAAGAFLTESVAFLFLGMALADLSAADQQQVIQLLIPGIRERYRRKGPRSINPSQASQAKPGDLVVVEGAPTYVEEVVHKRQTFLFIDGITIPIWIDEHYHTYDLKDDRASRGLPLPMITARRVKRLEEGAARFGGLLKEFTIEGNPKKKGVYFEPIFFTRLDTRPGT